MSKLTLNHLANLQNESTAVSTINANMDTITTAFDNTLSRDGTTPNTMSANLDMNSNQILNLSAPTNTNSPVRLADVASISSGTFTVNTLPTGGSTNAVLHKASGTDYDATWTLTPSGLTSLGATTLNGTTVNVSGTEVFSGSSSGTTTVQASATASGTLTLPAATDTLVGKATTDTLTNKTYDTAGTGNVFKINGTAVSAVTGTGSAVLATSPSITTPTITGVSDASSAASGKVGEYLESIVALGSAASTGATGTPQNITSLVLTAGDWEVSGQVTYVSPSVSNVFHASQASLSTTSATHNLVANAFSNQTYFSGTAIALDNPYASGIVSNKVGPYRVNVNAGTTVFLVSTLNWVTSTQPTAYGTIRARRVR